MCVGSAGWLCSVFMVGVLVRGGVVIVALGDVIVVVCGCGFGVLLVLWFSMVSFCAVVGLLMRGGLGFRRLW